MGLFLHADTPSSINYADTLMQPKQLHKLVSSQIKLEVYQFFWYVRKNGVLKHSGLYTTNITGASELQRLILACLPAK